ncbi:MAG: ferrochelatase [Rhizobiales bacterium]|nr:ferrochelatase [Hyphomicrobiales bacterium]
MSEGAIRNGGARRPEGHPAIAVGKIGILLVNLGTPEATDYWSMRRYLKEFLSDRRVVETNPALWWVILNGIILTTRPKRSGHAYEKIWNKERNESPLKTITRAQAENTAAAFRDVPEVIVDWAMRYGLPPLGERLKALKEAGCDRILLFPLYPQYSASTTATALDAAYDALKTMRWQPAIRTVPPYFDHPAYIDALAQSVRMHLSGLGWEPDLILASFHGLPESYFLAGDPYHCHCQKTARLLREALGLSDEKLKVVFQSRFGKAEWLKPYAQDTVEGLPTQGVKRLVMIAPGFASDCVETLEEVGIGLKETFLAKGGEKFSLVPCLNDSAESIAMIAAIARQELAGWRG